MTAVFSNQGVTYGKHQKHPRHQQDDPVLQEAIHCGVLLARKYDAKLQVLHLVSNPVDMKVVNAPGLFPNEEYKNYKNIQREAKEELDKVIKQEIRDEFSIKELISDRNPIEEIVKVVSEEKIDLIVMLAHEEGRIEHALFGETTMP